MEGKGIRWDGDGGREGGEEEVDRTVTRNNNETSTWGYSTGWINAREFPWVHSSLENKGVEMRGEEQVSETE